MCYASPLSAVLIQVAFSGAAPLTVTSDATASAEGAPQSLLVAYGTNLSSTVSLRDSAGVAYTPAALATSSSEVVFEVPAAASLGAALVTIGSQTAAALVSAVAPSLFTVDAAGLAAAYVTRVAPGNVQTLEAIFAVQGGSYVPVPIDLSPTDQVYLILFGTGIRGAGGNVTVTVGGVSVPVTYAGPQEQYLGLDQINVLLPTKLAGTGTVNIVLTAATKVSNAIYVVIQ